MRCDNDGWLSFSEECLRLQGIPDEIADLAKELGVSDSQLMAACGNAWPVHMISKVVSKIAKSMGWK